MKHYNSQEEYLKAQTENALESGVVVLKQGERGLKGDKGDRGDKGEKGDRGANGKDGVNGLNGIDGKDGINGINGLDGIDGRDGKDGVEITAEEVKTKLESLKKDERLDISAIKGMDDLRTDISNHATEQARGILYAGLLENNSGDGVVWGEITGTLSNQTDLQAVLDTKATKSFAIAMSIAL